MSGTGGRSKRQRNAPVAFVTVSLRKSRAAPQKSNPAALNVEQQEAPDPLRKPAREHQALRCLERCVWDEVHAAVMGCR